jgi:hypothetical protein
MEERIALLGDDLKVHSESRIARLSSSRLLSVYSRPRAADR